MIEDLDLFRAIRLDLDTILEELCCEPLTFMWKNSLLEPRDEWFSAGRTNNNQMAQMRFIMGFRVRRQFMFLKRDKVLYRCPFCTNELVIPLGYTDFKGSWMNATIALEKGLPAFSIPRSRLIEELKATKKLCKGVWPPKD